MFAAVRRCLAAAAVALMLTSCGNAGQPVPYDATGIDGLIIPTPTPDPQDFVEGVDNPWLAWEPGSARTYAVTRGGEQIGTWTVTVEPSQRRIVGIEATVVRQHLELAGATTEETTDYLAQDRDGNVWWLGHVGADGAWRADGGTSAGLWLPAEPRAGDGWVSAVEPQVVTRALGAAEVDGWGEALETTVEGVGDQRRYYVEGHGLVRLLDIETATTYDLQ